MTKSISSILKIFLIVSAFAFATSHSPALAKESTDQVIVTFDSNFSSEAKSNILSQAGFNHKKTINGFNLTVGKRKTGKTLTESLNQLKNISGVISVEPDDLVEPVGKPSNPSNSLKPNDPNYKKQWHLPKIQADRAWFRNKATNIVLGVCDTGVQADHPDLVNSLIPSLGYNTADNTTNWSPVANHGTMVAGTMAATTNNSLGVAGVAWGAKIIPVRITNSVDGWAYTSDAAECITYLADRGAKAANISYRMAQYSAIETAAQYGLSRNMITVLSAGNDGVDPGWADFPSFLAVSATNSSDGLASFSSYGTYVDLAAPGVNIYTTNTSSSYSYVNGTSFSAPIVVGTIGMMYGANPNLSAAQMTAILLASTDDLGPVGEDIYFGRGRVNVYKAVYNASLN